MNDPCPEKPNLRTLFLSNLPPWSTADALQRLFRANGPVDRVILQSNASSGPPPADEEANCAGFKFGYVVFERPSGVSRAMEKMDLSKPRVLFPEGTPTLVGVAAFQAQYNASVCADVDSLMLRIEEGVANLDKRREAEKTRAEEEFEAGDDDGWVTVSRHTTKRSVGHASAKAQAKVKAREAKKRKRKELENFYKHQMKEKKLKRLSELKEKFEKDKEKQLQMRVDRKFKPS